MDIVSLNAHFPGGNLRQRAHALLDMLTRTADISTKVICIQEGCSTLHRALSARLARTHEVYPPRSRSGASMFLITLVPHSLVLTRPITRAAFPDHMSPMRREAHVCAVGRTTLVHTHLESCGDSAHYRAAQVEHLLRVVPDGPLLVVGDLNGYGGSWARQYMQRGVRVESKRMRLSPSLTPHFLYSYHAAA
jgi:endonuclease/exonuclease/phosphatase family metal-dependent hydrolase